MAVTRYIFLTKLIPPLLSMVDEEKLSVSTAADYAADLPHNEQADLLTVMDRLDVIPGRNKLVRIRQYSKNGTLTITVIDAILSEIKHTPVQVTLKKDRLKQYFPIIYTAQQMEEIIFSRLNTWRAQNAAPQS